MIGFSQYIGQDHQTSSLDRLEISEADLYSRYSKFRSLSMVLILSEIILRILKS